MNAPLVSVISVCYNQAQFCIKTLDSIYKQTYKNFELIIVDDCSEDSSVGFIKEWVAKHNDINCIFIIHEQNRGLCRTLNEALLHCKGDYISMIACDDIMLSEKIEEQVSQMIRLPIDYKILYSDAELIDENDNLLPGHFISAHRNFKMVPSGNIFNELFIGNFIPGMTALIRRDVFDTVGNYDENIIYEDYDMWLRIAHKYLFFYQDKITCQYRIHKDSVIRTIGIRDHDIMLKIRIKYIGVSKILDVIIIKEIIRRSELMFVNNAENWQFWIEKRFKYDKSMRSFIYYLAAIFDIPFDKLKKLKHFKKHN